MTTNRNSDRRARGPRRSQRVVAATAIAVGLVLAMGGISRWLPLGPERTPASFLQGAEEGVRASGDGDFVFFTFRRNIWAFRKSAMTVRFYSIPETTERTQEVEESRVYQIDARDFPLDDLRFQVSERNLTNYLWLLNPKTGKARILKARRDGIIEESMLLDVTRGT